MGRQHQGTGTERGTNDNYMGSDGDEDGDEEGDDDEVKQKKAQDIGPQAMILLLTMMGAPCLTPTTATSPCSWGG